MELSSSPILIDESSNINFNHLMLSLSENNLIKDIEYRFEYTHIIVHLKRQ